MGFYHMREFSGQPLMGIVMAHVEFDGGFS